MDLSTTYLGLKLAHPLMPGASPLVDDLDTVRRLEDAGAAAIVMHSLFEEQITSGAGRPRSRHVDAHAESFAEATSYFPRPEDYRLGPRRLPRADPQDQGGGEAPGDRLAQRRHPGRLARLRAADAAGRRRRARAERLLPADRPRRDRRAGRGHRRSRWCKEVKKGVKIPVAVKLSPFYSSLPHFARRLDAAGADGLVLFNRFYQPDIDVEKLEVKRTLQYSTSAELHLRLRWLAILSGHAAAVAGGHRRRAHGARRRQGGHGRRPRGADGLGAAPERAGAPQDAARGAGAAGSRSTSTSRSARCGAA